MMDPISAASPDPRAANARTDALVDRAKAVDENSDAAEIVATSRQLEGVFLGMVFEEMAKTVKSENSLFPDSPGRKMYEQWFRTEISRRWAAQGGAGLGDAMARALGVDAEDLDVGAGDTGLGGRGDWW